MTTPSWRQLLAGQLELLDRLEEIGERQLVAIEHGRMNELLSLLSEKQQPLEALHRTAVELRRRRDELAGREGTAAEGADEFRRGYQLASRRYDQLMRLEQNAQQQLQIGRDRIAQRLQQTASAIRVADAYGSSGAPDCGGSLDLASS